MANVKFGPIFSDMRGAIGGTIVSRNSSGPYAKANAMPTNARTLKSIAQRALFGQLSSCWRELSAEEMNAWNLAAELTPRQNSMGEEYFLTGFQLFMQYNGNIVGMNPANVIHWPVADVGFPFFNPGTSSFAIIGEEAEGFLALTINGTVMVEPLTDFSLEIMVTPYISLGINRPKESLFRRVGYYTNWGTEQTYAAPFLSANGGWVDGNWMFVRLYIIYEPGGQKQLFAETTISILTPP